MKIKFLFRKSIIIFSPFFLVILLLLSFNVFKKDYSYGHKSIFFYPSSIDWLNYYRKLYLQKFKNNFNFLMYESARSAILHSLRCLNITSKDQVIVSSFTCDAVTKAVINSGAKIVYVDINHECN